MRHTAQLSRIKFSLSPDWDLTPAEVESRRAQYGSNTIIEIHKNRWIELIQDTLKDPMIWFLLVTSLLFALLKIYNQSVILLLATIPLIVMDAFLHWRTQASVQALGSQLSVHANVIRDHVEMTLPAMDIVPGDLVVVQAGMPFPADGLLVAGDHLQVDESALTGESFPVKKEIPDFLHAGAMTQEMDGCFWGFAGTRLLTGRALFRVVNTGQETLYGEIAQSALGVSQTRTPLQAAVQRLVFTLIISASILCVILAVVRYLQGFGIIDAILSAATLAVAALPDEFPVVLTFFLALGVYRLAKKNALVRRAVSVENIGRVTCICSDKTGTLTEGFLELARQFPAEGEDPQALLTIATLASRMESNDFLDLAILDEVRKRHVTSPGIVTTFPFTEARKRETSVVIHSENEFLIATKGAPETILSLCVLSDSEKEKWSQQVIDLARAGYKVIACARQTIKKTDSPAEPESGYQFMGLLAFSDPPRKEVPAAVKACQGAKIHVLMLTGDHPETAESIANAIGLGNGHPVILLGQNIKSYLQQNGNQALLKVDVIARAIPSQKLEIVTALQSVNEIVAVTGDGVNDVPALKVADVGIAMGDHGTQSARDVSDIILLDDNFDSIVKAIGEGRQLFKNLQASFKYLLIIHMPFILSAAIIPLFGFPLLYYPIHIVFIELIIHPSCMLVFQDVPISSALAAVNSKNRHVRFFTRPDWFGILGAGTFLTIVVVSSYIFSIPTGDLHARSLVLLELCLSSAALTAGLSGFRTRISRCVVLATIVFGCVLIQVPWIARVFMLEPIHWHDWLLAIASSLVALLFIRSAR